MQPTLRPVMLYAAVYSFPGCLPDDPDGVMLFAREREAEEYVAEQETAYAEENEEEDSYVWDIIGFAAWQDGDGNYFEEDRGDYYPLIVD